MTVRALMVTLGMLCSSGAIAEEIVIGLTDNVIDVDADFSGAQIVLFGVVEGTSGADDATNGGATDIISVVRGPEQSFTLRQITKEGPFWIPGEAVRIENAPGLYLTNSTRPLSEFTSPELRKRFNFGTDSINAHAVSSTTAAAISIPNATSNFIEAEKKTGRYKDTSASINFKKNALFSIDIDLPPTTSVGDYSVEVYLIRAGKVISADNAALSVQKVGLERRVYELAHNQPLGYGIICVAMSLVAGWLGSIAIRK